MKQCRASSAHQAGDEGVTIFHAPRLPPTPHPRPRLEALRKSHHRRSGPPPVRQTKLRVVSCGSSSNFSTLWVGISLNIGRTYVLVSTHPLKSVEGRLASYTHTSELTRLTAQPLCPPAKVMWLRSWGLPSPHHHVDRQPKPSRQRGLQGTSQARSVPGLEPLVGGELGAQRLTTSGDDDKQ